MLKDMRLTKMPSATAARGLMGHTFRRSWLRPLLRAGLVIGLVVLVAAIAAFAVVISGPTEIGILRGRVEQTVAGALGPGYQVEVGRTLVDVDPALGLIVLVDDVVIRDASAEVVATVPSTRLAVDAVSLLTFRGLIRSVELNGAEISFTRASDGRVTLGRAGRPAGTASPPAPTPAPDGTLTSAGGFPDLFAALQILDRGIEPSIQAATRAGFERFAMVQATIDVADDGQSAVRRFPRTDLTVSVKPDTSEVSVELNASGYSGRWSATADRSVDPATGERQLSARFSQLTLADLFPRFGETEAPLTSDVPLFGQATVKLSADGAVQDATVRLDLGAGTIDFRGGRDNILLDEATIKLRWDVVNNLVVVEPSTYFLGDTRGTVVGTIRPSGDPMERRYAFNLESRGTVLAARDANAPPLSAQRMAVSGTADVPAKFIRFDSAVIVSANGSVAGTGSIDFSGVSPAVKMVANISPMPVEVAKQIWPPFIAGGARRWVLDHVSNGRIAAGRMEADIPAGILWTGQRNIIPDEALRLDFRLENITFTTLGDLPPVVNAYGNAALAGSTFGIDIERGQVITATGRKAQVTAGAFAVPTMVPVTPDARVELQMSGDVAALGEIADSAPFNALKRQKISASSLSGTGSANLSARWPMRMGLTEADVDWKVTVSVGNFSSTQPVANRMISDGKVNITVTPDDVSIVGRARIDGVVADVNMSQPIGDDKQLGPGKRQVRLTLDEQARRKLGMGLEDIVGGTIDAVVSDAAYGKGQHYEIDLRRARLTLSALGWSKGVGVAGKLSFDMISAGEGYRIENIKVAGDGFGLTGKAVLDGKYGLVSADIDDFALRKGDQANFVLKRERSGYTVTASGKAFDIRGLMTRFRRPQTTGSPPPDLTLEAKVDKLTGFNNEVLSKAEIALASAAGTLRKIEIKGELGRSTVVVGYADQPQNATMSLTTADAGAVFRFIDLYQRVAGGTMRLHGVRSGGANEPLIGSFDVSNFAIVGEPVMARVASTTDRADGFNPNSVPFDRMQLNFTLRNSVIVIDDAILRSAAIGATFDGRLELAAQHVLLQGTYLPAYAINNMFGKIPVLGLALGGGAKGGLVGITFKVEGAMDNPAVHINPLSAIAPGMFRKIFEFH